MLKQNKSTGFTLIEVMLAMTLLSIMVTLLFASLAICAESWNKGEAKIAEVNEKAVVYQFFKRHLPSIKPLTDGFSTDKPQFSFQGEEDQIQFVSVFPASAERKGLQLFKVVFESEGTIKVRLSPFYPTTEGQQWQTEDVVLLEHVKDFKVSYFGKERLGTDAHWSNNWSKKKQLPALIKINIELESKSFWPEMIFALKLAADTAEFELDTK
jgi:general secretion pathway protein J